VEEFELTNPLKNVRQMSVRIFVHEFDTSLALGPSYSHVELVLEKQQYGTPERDFSQRELRFPLLQLLALVLSIRIPSCIRDDLLSLLSSVAAFRPM